MVRGNRVKTFDYNNIGSLTVTAGGILAAQHSQQPINGTIQKVAISTNNWATTGSIFVQESGTGEVLCAIRGAAAGATYPVIVSTINTGAASAIEEDRPVTNSNIILTGSGLGNAKSGTLISVVYI